MVTAMKRHDNDLKDGKGKGEGRVDKFYKQKKIFV
jgi:hypothetical protein